MAKMKYNIYKLIHPLTNEVVYVGRTKRDISERLKAHISQSRNNYSPLARLIKELKELKLSLRVELIIKTTKTSDESLWITKYKLAGAPLLNQVYNTIRPFPERFIEFIGIVAA